MNLPELCSLSIRIHCLPMHSLCAPRATAASEWIEYVTAISISTCSGSRALMSWRNTYGAGLVHNILGVAP